MARNPKVSKGWISAPVNQLRLVRVQEIWIIILRLGNYILDFYCADAKLAVELDGSQHGHPEGMERDNEREKFLAEQDIMTLRFWNRQWRENKEGCLLEIWNTVQHRSGCVRVMKNAEGQRFIPPDLKQIKFRKD